MKTVFALFSALMFIGAQVPVIGQPVTVMQAKANAGCHCARACCSASQSNPDAPVPAPPAPAGVQYQLLVPAEASLVWEVPTAPIHECSISGSPSLKELAAPIFARDCAFLI